MKLSDLVLGRQPELEVKRSLDDIFDEEPVPLTTFVQDKKYLANPPLSPIQYDAVRITEQVLFPETYHLMAEEFDPYWSPLRMVNFVTLMWGKGSGKDHICRMCALRIAHLLLCLRSPQEYFEMPEQDTIHMLNVATSSGQAQQAYFDALKRAVDRKGGWFEDKADVKMNIVECDKNIQIISGHSDAESQEGKNLILGVADEIDGFRVKDEYKGRGTTEREPTNTAEAILDMLHTSASTRFETFKRLVISYPRYLGSMIMRLRDAAELDVKENGEESLDYYSGPYPTWVVNPRVKIAPERLNAKPGEPYWPKQYDRDYKKDPVLSRARYECKPARAVSPWFRNDETILQAFEVPPQEKQPIEVEYVLEEREHAKVWGVKFHFADWFLPREGCQYAIHGDIGIKHDRAGVAMSHVLRWEDHTYTGQDEEGGDIKITETRPVVQNDFTLSFEADESLTPSREVQIRWYRDLCWELMRRGFSIGYYSFDGYQSTDTMQILEQRGIETEKVSMDKDTEPWRTLRDVAYDFRLRAWYRPILVDELLALQKTLIGKVDHPPGGSKDEADAFCGSVLGAIKLGGSEGEAVVTPTETRAEVVDTGIEQPLGMDLMSLGYASGRQRR